MNDITKTVPGRAELRLGGLQGCLWRLPGDRAEHELLLLWERFLAGRGLAASRLSAGDGAAWVDLDERAVAVLTVWDGDTVGRIDTPDALVNFAGFLAYLRRVGGQSGLSVPPTFGQGWADSWRERTERLRGFIRLADCRLYPTRFDQVFLEQNKYFQPQAERSAAELSAVLAEIEPGLAVNTVDRHRFYLGQSGPAAKIVHGIGRAYPVRDLYRLFARVLPRLAWEQEAAAAAIAAYHRECPLSAADMRVLQAGLRFPSEHYRLALHYFLNHKTCPLRTFLKRQASIWARERARARLLEELPLLLP